MTDMNWDDPESRLRFLEANGIDKYNAALRAHQRNSTVSTVNGYPIRPVGSQFGRLFMVGGTKMAFMTLEQATEYAMKQPRLGKDNK